MKKNSNLKPEVNEGVKEDIAKLAKQIENGQYGNDEFTKNMTDEVANSIIELAKLIEDGGIGDKELANYLALILRRLSREKEKKIKKDKVKKKTALEVLMEQLLRTFAQNNANKKNNINKNKNHEPGYMVKQMINDLDRAISKLVSASRFDSDVNTINLIEDTIAVNQKVAALTGNKCKSVRGLSTKLVRAKIATSTQALDSTISNLSTLKSGRAFESWSQANEIDYNHGGGLDLRTEAAKDYQEEMIKKLRFSSENAKIPSGPDDIPITETAKKQKEKENQEWINTFNYKK